MTASNRLETLARLKAEHPEWGRRRLAEASGVPLSSVQRFLKRLEKPENQTNERFSFDDKKGELSSMSPGIQTLDALLSHAQVDLSVWEVDRHVINKWEVGAVVEGKIITSPLFQIKAWLRRVRSSTEAVNLLKEIVEDIRKKAPARPAKLRNVALKTAAKKNLLELSIFDLHFGKLCWGQECGEDWDSKIAEHTYLQAVDELLARTNSMDVGHILLPIGNDFFNVDNAANTTTAGTPQSEDGRWQKSFVTGRKMMVHAIERVREVAPVSLIMVSGNHDYERLFYLGDVLEAWFHKTADVDVNNTAVQRKYFQWGECLLGFTHGNNEKHKDLPLIMATEAKEQWAKTRFREFHVGHWHQKREMHFQPVVEQNGIRVRIIPSLCPPDAWHKSKGYEGLRAAEAYVWSPEHGNVAQFSHHPA